MISRETFGSEFKKAARFVLQTFDRSVEIRKLHFFDESFRRAAIDHRENNLEAALDQLADLVFDAIEKAREP